MWKISENLYLAQLPMIEGPTRKEEFEKNHIKRVLTVMTEPIPMMRRLQDVDYKFIHVFDMPNEPILENGVLQEALRYIEDAVEHEENVVVHCLAAVSRSVSMCVGYQMWKNQWSLEKALKMVQSIRKAASPNAGFLAQLKIWEKCGLDFSPERYKNLRVTVPGVSDADAKYLWRQPVIDDKTKIRFKCRSCRKLLFTSDNIVHSVKENCPYVVEPMEWLLLTGRQCSLSHSCGAKLGNFFSQGSRCQVCSKFVRLWIDVDKSKVDKVLPTPIVESS